MESIGVSSFAWAGYVSTPVRRRLAPGKFITVKILRHL
jgi:hypothetical protein